MAATYHFTFNWSWGTSNSRSRSDRGSGSSYPTKTNQRISLYNTRAPPIDTLSRESNLSSTSLHQSYTFTNIFLQQMEYFSSFLKKDLLTSISNFTSNIKIVNYFFHKTWNITCISWFFFTDTDNATTNKPYIQKTGLVSRQLPVTPTEQIQILAHPACELVTASKIQHTEKDSVHKSFLLKISHFGLTILRTVAMRMKSQERLRGWCVSETHC